MFRKKTCASGWQDLLKLRLYGVSFLSRTRVFLTSRDKTRSLVLLHSGVSKQLTVLHVTHLLLSLKKVMKEMKKKNRLQEEET
jgi:hypothetical protein